MIVFTGAFRKTSQSGLCISKVTIFFHLTVASAKTSFGSSTIICRLRTNGRFDSKYSSDLIEKTEMMQKLVKQSSAHTHNHHHLPSDLSSLNWHMILNRRKAIWMAKARQWTFWEMMNIRMKVSQLWKQWMINIQLKCHRVHCWIAWNKVAMAVCWPQVLGIKCAKVTIPLLRTWLPVAILKDIHYTLQGKLVDTNAKCLTNVNNPLQRTRSNWGTNRCASSSRSPALIAEAWCLESYYQLMNWPFARPLSSVRHAILWLETRAVVTKDSTIVWRPSKQPLKC